MGAPRWMRLLLVTSLALNLLVLAALAGAGLSGRWDDGPGRRGPRPVGLELGPVTRALEPSDRRAVLDALQGRGDLRPPTREERAAAFAATLAAARAEPFDPARMEAALSQQSDRVAQVERAVQGAVVQRLAALTPEGRAAFADRLEDELRRGPGHD